MAKPKTNSVVERLKSGSNTLQSFSTQNGMSMQVLVTDGVPQENVIINGQRISAEHVLQAAAIMKLIAPGASKLCVFHGLINGTTMGCTDCRNSTRDEVVTAQRSNAVVFEDEA